MRSPYLGDHIPQDLCLANGGTRRSNSKPTLSFAKDQVDRQLSGLVRAMNSKVNGVCQPNWKNLDLQRLAVLVASACQKRVQPAASVADGPRASGRAQ